MVVGLERPLRFSRFFGSPDHGDVGLHAKRFQCRYYVGRRLPNAHTHHITMTDAVISYDTSKCPINSPATTNPGFMVTGQPGQVIVAANGGPAPFETGPPCIHATGLRQRRVGCRVFQRDSGVRRSCDCAFRPAGDPRRRSEDEVRFRQRTSLSGAGAVECRGALFVPCAESLRSLEADERQ